MKKIMFFLSTLILTGCASVEREMPEDVRKRINSIPVVSVNNLNADDEKVLFSKQKALIEFLSDWGFDPIPIGNYHFDLGCNYYLEKIIPYKKTGFEKHTEFFVFRDFSKSMEEMNNTNSSFCNPLRLKLIRTMSDVGHYGNRLYTVIFNPNESAKNKWEVEIKPSRFIPIDIKSNLRAVSKRKPYMLLRGEKDKEQHFYILGCSKYRIPVPLYQNNEVVSYEYEIEQNIVEAGYVGTLDFYMKRNLSSAVLRESEHWTKCEDRVKFVDLN